MARPKKQILLVDGDEARLAVRQFLLETRGFRVWPMQTARAALEFLGDMRELSVDLLLADLLLTGMDGNELMVRAKALHPCLPTLLVSGTVTDPARGLAADAFLPKGVEGGAVLIDRVRVLVARKRGPKPAIPRPVPGAGKGLQVAC